MAADDKRQTVGGYAFYTEKDAKLALAEEQKIKYLEDHIDYNAPDSIKYIYEKAIQERIFKTPVGLKYLKHLQEFLMEQSDIDSESISAIPLYVTFDSELRSQTRPARQRVASSDKDSQEKRKSAFIISVISNVLLAIAICTMFYVSLKSDQPNIFNYERALLDKYASWEQELSEREQTVRDRERELRINAAAQP